ncbi:MAG: DUF6240 domain-containing protein, partial [Clostridiales bacterium]|nr:DUF6240 domain-containing protein [Clostridiales bacterium]
MSSVHNLNNTSAGAPGASNLFVSRRAKAAPRFEPGERIFAIIQEKDASKAILNAENRGFSFELLAHEIIGEAGDRVSFEVISHNKNGLALRQIHATDNMAGRAVKHGKLKSLKDLMAENELTECTVSPLDYKELAETAEEKRAKEARALTIIRRNAGSAANSAGQAAVRALIAEGVDINKLDLSSLSTMITAISRDGLIEPPSASADPESLLRELDIPATRRNIAALEGIMSAIDAAKGIEPRAAAALIAREDDPTLENIYKYATAAPSTETEDIDGLDGMIEGLFAREGIENNSENMEAARLLITEGAELTAENLGLFKALMSIKDAENAGEPGDFIAQSLMLKALLLMKRGENPYNSSLRKPDIKPMDRTEFRRLAEDVRVIKADHIETALMKGLPATIQDLARLAASGETYGGAKNNAAKPHSAIRLQMEALAEINLRLTYEAANRLYQKNIRIDLLTLTGAVDALKAAEREGYEARLKALDIPASPENIDQVAEIIDAARAAGRVPDWGYGEIMSARVAFTMRSVASLAPAVTTSETALSVSARYAVFEASPSRRYGDGLKDARERYSRLLESLGFEATNANIKAARILGANNMDLSAENISAVKALDAKLTDISGRLHPMIAASMLKDKLNPLDMDIDDTLEYIKIFGDEYGETPDDALARHIYAMEKSGKLDGESREALISVYKMLHIIQNDGKG